MEEVERWLSNMDLHRYYLYLFDDQGWDAMNRMMMTRVRSIERAELESVIDKPGHIKDIWDHIMVLRQEAENDKLEKEEADGNTCISIFCGY